MKVKYYDDVIPNANSACEEPLYIDPFIPVPRKGYVAWEEAQNKKEKNMCYGQTTATNVTIAAPEKKDNSLSYIKDRARDIYYHHQNAIEEMFRDPRPETRKEAEKWIKDGNFRVDIHETDGEYHYSHFAWGKDKPDYDKMHKLQETLSKDMIDLKDTVSIITDEQARLDALKAFESKVYN